MPKTATEHLRAIPASSLNRPLGQDGQSMLETLVILPVMLILIFGAIQFGLIYHAKTTLNYAAYEAVRAGSLNCDKKYSSISNACTSEVGQFAAVKEGFARGLAPLYSYAEPSEKEHRIPTTGQVEAFQRARARIFNEFDAGYIRIERLNPTKDSFTDFGVDPVIANDNLMYRSRTPGNTSHKSIQEANLLHLRITYCYPLYVPFVGQLFKTINRVCSGDEPRIPLTAIAAMRMQVPVEGSSEYYPGNESR